MAAALLISESILNEYPLPITEFVANSRLDNSTIAEQTSRASEISTAAKALFSLITDCALFFAIKS